MLDWDERPTLQELAQDAAMNRDLCPFCGDPAHPLGHPDDDPCTAAADEEDRDLGVWEGTYGTEEWAR